MKELSKEKIISFYQYSVFGVIKDEVEASVKRAYRDVCRTIRGFARNQNKESIKEEAENFLIKEIKTVLESRTIDSQIKFDEWHKSVSDKLKKIFKDQEFHYGQAQKWINMSFKYLLLLNREMIQEIEPYCHVPIDRYILKDLDDTIIEWSILDNYEEYLKLQREFQSKGENPLLREFDIWLKQVKENK